MRSFLLRGSIFVILAGWLTVTPFVSAQTAMPQEALVDLVKPSVVRVAEHITGTARIPDIKVDIRKRLVAVIPEKYTDISVDEYLVGSGFIIHPDGYIATNAHVVSQETVKQRLASENALSALYENALFLSDSEMQEFLQSETENSFAHQVLQYVIQQSVFDLKSERAVLRPGSEKQAVNDLIAEGFPATIVSMNENFLEDEKDVALLKINASDLPALALGESGSILVGRQAFIFGFPATAELNKQSFLEATFTQGVVSAIKQSVQRDFKLFQTDAKVSEGSSGGPLLDEKGSVIGMVTFQTDAGSRDQGDSFAFALPIELVKQVAQDAGIIVSEGAYGQFFKQGFDELSSRHCDKAIRAFQQASEKSNPLFVSTQALDVYLKKCTVLQASGLSLDTPLDEWENSIRAFESPFLYLIALIIILVVLFAGILFLVVRRMRREEMEIKDLESRLTMDEARMQQDAQSRVEKKSKIV